MNSKIKFAAAVFIIILAGLAQNTDIFVLYGIKPDLLLSALIALSFFLSDFFIYAGFIILAIILLTVSGKCCFDSFAFTIIVFAAPFIGHRLRWQPLLNNLLLIGAGTILFYLISAPAFLASNLLFVAGELVYNLVAGLIFFEIFKRLIHDKNNTFHN